MAIKIVRNNAGNCINFVGTSNPAYWNACLSAEVNTANSDNLNIINDIRTTDSANPIYEFFNIPYLDFSDKDGNAFSSNAEAIAYINQQANVVSNTGKFILSNSDSLGFSVDSSGTTILVDNGDYYPINAINASANSDNHIDISTALGSIIIYKDLRVANTTVAGSSVSSTLATAVNQLNGLFTNTTGFSSSGSGQAPDLVDYSFNVTEGESINHTSVLSANSDVVTMYAFEGLPSWLAGNQSTGVILGTAPAYDSGNAANNTITYTLKAANPYGISTVTVTVTVLESVFANTKSIIFDAGSSAYLGANASLLDGILGRSGNGSGSSDAWSLSMWLKPADVGTGRVLFYFGDNDTVNGGYIELRITASKKLRLRYGSNNNYIQFTTPNTLSANTWQNILITYTGGSTENGSGGVSSSYSTFKIYIDGSLQSTSNSNSNYGYSGGIDPDNLRIGRQSSGLHLQDDKIDEVAVWNSDQSGNVSSIYNSGSTHNLSDLSAAPSHWWRMGDGDTYPNIQDNIGNAHFVMYNMNSADIITDAP